MTACTSGKAVSSTLRISMSSGSPIRQAVGRHGEGRGGEEGQDKAEADICGRGVHIVRYPG